MNTGNDPLQDPLDEALPGSTARIKQLVESLAGLSDNQVELLLQLVSQFRVTYQQIWRNSDSDLVGECILRDLGDALRFHHGVSREPLSKDRFEYALDRSARMCGLPSELAPKGNPGHDITIGAHRFSLKTEASSGINAGKVHISKFMELGKGEWQLDLLKELFFRHMEKYDRILVLRCLSKYPRAWVYELVEIPKALLQSALSGQLRVAETSRQNPKPGYCDVVDELGALKFQLYFDGGTERKLQIRSIRMDLCTVHATWSFAAHGPS